jgi:phenylalanyl-tRNA synthetase beta chain
MHDSSIHLNKSIKNDLFSIKGTINSLLKRMNFRDVSLETVDKSESQFDKAFIIEVNNKNIGRYGKISSSMIKKLDLDIREIYGFEINLKDLLSLISTNATKYEPINYLPKVERDLNFVVDETIEVGDIVKEIGLLKNKLLVSVVPKNIFRHSSIGDLKKSVTINLEFQHPSKTLEDKDVNLIINEIINVVSKNFNAKLRQ